MKDLNRLPDRERLQPTTWAMQRCGYRSRGAFLDFAKANGLPFIRLSARELRWDPADVEAWIASRRIGGAR